MKSRVQLIVLHITGCAVFLALPVLFSPVPLHAFRLLNDPYVQRDFIGEMMLIAFFYLNFFLFIPKFYFTKQYLLFFLLAIFSLAAVLVLPSLITGVQVNAYPVSEFSSSPVASSQINRGDNNTIVDSGPPILLFLVIFSFSLMMKISNRWKQTEKEKLNAEVSFLKAQINPHFLFNTLNSIYSLALQKDNKTADAIVQLSGLMRYIIKDANDYMVPLEKEIDYIGNYVSLQKTRLGDTVNINYHLQGDLPGKQIAPLILISFIENAFKHGVNPDKNSTIEISIAIIGINLRLYVFNKKTNVAMDEPGIGLQNTKERLQLLYPSRYELVVSDKDDTYTVHLLMSLE